MSRAPLDVRIYPARPGGFDVVSRLRRGFQGHGNLPTLDTALAAARAVEGRVADQPIYVFDYGLSDQRATLVVAGLAANAGAE